MLNVLVSSHTNELVKSSELISVVLLNTAGDPVVAVGDTNLDCHANSSAKASIGRTNSVTFVISVEGASVVPKA